jgi:hypothetical protein
MQTEARAKAGRGGGEGLHYWPRVPFKAGSSGASAVLKSRDRTPRAKRWYPVRIPELDEFEGSNDGPRRLGRKAYRGCLGRKQVQGPQPT